MTFDRLAKLTFAVLLAVAVSGCATTVDAPSPDKTETTERACFDTGATFGAAVFEPTSPSSSPKGSR